MQIQVISLTTALKRREHIQSEFGKQEIRFNFFDALTPDDAEPLANELNLKYDIDCITKGELACFMSHVALWKKMLDENIPYMAIFEDDVFLGKDSKKILGSSRWIGNDVDVIKLEAFAKKVLLGKDIPILETNRSLAILKQKNLGTAGYILSLQGARNYMDFIKNNNLIPLDELMFDMYLKENHVYQISPALCIQEMMLFPEKLLQLPSDLVNARKKRMKKLKKKGLTKVRQELLRIIHQLQDLFFGQKNEFK